MYRRLTSFVLRVLKVPHEPQPPEGEPTSLRVFHAGRNFFKLKMMGWGIGQLVAFAGIVFWLELFISLDQAADEARAQAGRRPAAAATVVPTPRPAKPSEATVSVAAPTLPADPKAKTVRQRRPTREMFSEWKGVAVQLMLLLPAWALPVLWVFKIAGILAYFVQLPLTYLVARMDYELRWYMVTDRSLRIRHGVWNIAESTMSFANVQQVVVSQGPLQRLLGLADVKVTSAGGGAGPQGHEANDMHTGLFHAVEDASAIRDLIQERLRRFRATGLGDPDDHGDHPAVPAAASPASSGVAPQAIAAAKELLAEARALRADVASASGR